MKLAAISLIAAAALAVPAAVGADATELGVGYICGAEHSTVARATDAVMLAGVGNGHTPADTNSHEAQAWLDEGLNLYHSFNHNEASAAFAKAAALDPKCALCAWGVALGDGATLNYGITPQQRELALEQAEHAKALLKPGDARAQALIATLLVRYGKDTPDAQREKRYGAALDELAKRWPADDEIADLAAHALMIPARADDYSGVAEAERLVKTVLARRPDDTAAIHYYIHASEFAGHPAEALPYAERLAGLTPGASHMVHMAAHTLMHVGDYEQVAVVDAEALKVDADTEKRLAYPGPLSAQMYYLHNFTFGLAGAMMAGDAKLALKYAQHADAAFPIEVTLATPTGSIRPGGQAGPSRRNTALARSLVALGRYDPDRVLAMADAPGDALIVKVYRHYARGEALATRGDGPGVRREADAVAALGGEALKASDNGTANVAVIAGQVLAGRASLLAHDPAKAAEHFAAGADKQEKVYPVDKNFDPPPWWYPVRRSLAAADLAAGKPADAAREARASLKDWPDDALALRVLSQAEARTGDAKAAGEHMAQARKAWRGDLGKVAMDLT